MVVKIQKGTMIFLIDCDMRGFNESVDIDQRWTIIIPNFTLVIELNMAALKQCEPPGHGHYLFSSYCLG